jgi:hypothetical protein
LLVLDEVGYTSSLPDTFKMRGSKEQQAGEKREKELLEQGARRPLKRRELVHSSRKPIFT